MPENQLNSFLILRMKQLNDARLNMGGGWFQRVDVGRVGNKLRILN